MCASLLRLTRSMPLFNQKEVLPFLRFPGTLHCVSLVEHQF